MPIFRKAIKKTQNLMNIVYIVLLKCYIFKLCTFFTHILCYLNINQNIHRLVINAILFIGPLKIFRDPIRSKCTGPFSMDKTTQYLKKITLQIE